MESQRMPKSQSNPQENKEQSWKYYALNFQQYYKAIVIKQHGFGKKKKKREREKDTHTQINETEMRAQK